MPTLEQIRAARALLGWSQSDLAAIAGLSQTGIARIENGTNHPNSQTLAKIEKAFDTNNIEFIDTSGVKKRETFYRILKGSAGMADFMDDVYNVLKDKGGEFCVFNANPPLWVNWIGEEKFREHNDRMVRIKDKIHGKIIVHASESQLLASDYAEYRYSNHNEYDERKSLYSYGNRLAFFDFEPNNLTITVMERAEFAHGFRVLFDAAWAEASKRNDRP